MCFTNHIINKNLYSLILNINYNQELNTSNKKYDLLSIDDDINMIIKSYNNDYIYFKGTILYKTEFIDIYNYTLLNYNHNQRIFNYVKDINIDKLINRKIYDKIYYFYEENNNIINFFDVNMLDNNNCLFSLFKIGYNNNNAHASICAYVYVFVHTYTSLWN